MKKYHNSGCTNRRSFLQRSVLLGLAGAASSLIPAQNAGAFLFGKKEHKVSRTRLVMGTYVSITAIHRSQDQADEAISLAFTEIDRLNGLLSRHISSTPISRLNEQGYLKGAPVELVEVVNQSRRYHVQTNGAFDITVLPLLQLYDASFSSGAVPASSEISERLELVGGHNVKVEGRNIRFENTGMGITTDGIAKGYIVDRASEVMRKQGIDNHLINAGGDIRTHGNAMKGKPWTIAVQDPSKGGDYPEIITMNSGAVATSGNYEIFYDKAKLFHHIVDPKNGRSPHLSKSVTILAPTVCAADALATSIFVLGPSEGTAFIDSHDSLRSLVVDSNNGVVRSEKWPVRP